MKACMKPNSSELMEAIRERGKQLKAIKDDAKSLNSQIAQTENDIKTMQKKMEEEDRKFQNRMNEIVKEQSLSHRAEFNKALPKMQSGQNMSGIWFLKRTFQK